jgi:hypothetical protein
MSAGTAGLSSVSAPLHFVSPHAVRCLLGWRNCRDGRPDVAEKVRHTRTHARSIRAAADPALLASYITAQSSIFQYKTLNDLS